MSLSQHPVQPRSAAGTVPLAPFVILGVAWTAIVVAWLAWAAGRIAAAIVGVPAGPGFASMTDREATGWLTRMWF